MAGGSLGGAVNTGSRMGSRFFSTCTGSELEAIESVADERELPLGTAAYQLLARGLGRARSRK